MARRRRGPRLRDLRDGGDRNWIFFILVPGRGPDAPQRAARARIRARLPLSYALLLGYLVLVDGRTLVPLTEVTKVVSLYA